MVKALMVYSDFNETIMYTPNIRATYNYFLSEIHAYSSSNKCFNTKNNPTFSWNL
jgi:hypothetical protein